MFYSLFLYGIIDWIFKNISARMVWEGVRWVRQRTKMGVVARVHVHTMREGGQTLVTMVHAY